MNIYIQSESEFPYDGGGADNSIFYRISDAYFIWLKSKHSRAESTLWWFLTGCKPVKPSTKWFSRGQRVKYIRPFCESEYGVVSSTNQDYVFVKYDKPWLCLIDANAPYTAKATRPEDLTRLGWLITACKS
jgi:hypothetical protein